MLCRILHLLRTVPGALAVATLVVGPLSSAAHAASRDRQARAAKKVLPVRKAGAPLAQGPAAKPDKPDGSRSFVAPCASKPADGKASLKCATVSRPAPVDVPTRVWAGPVFASQIDCLLELRRPAFQAQAPPFMSPGAAIG
jgi:hypothetical protein